jgi:hypothetical protein
MREEERSLPEAGRDDEEGDKEIPAKICRDDRSLLQTDRQHPDYPPQYNSKFHQGLGEQAAA